jgi:protein-L-isoaspartate(D-aspartate) O-methyltransferase
MEIVAPLAWAAQERLRRLGYDNVQVRAGDAYRGWAEAAPFDGIIVTAAAPGIPPSLIEQLRPGGRLVIPVGPPFGHQELQLLVKGGEGKIEVSSILGVAFVPLTRESQRNQRG